MLFLMSLRRFKDKLGDQNFPLFDELDLTKFKYYGYVLYDNK